MSALAHLIVLAALFTALRGRLPWTRLGGTALGVAAVTGLATSWSNPAVRLRLADPDLWPGLVFVLLAGPLAWWTMRREQERTAPIHEQEEPESLSRWLPIRPFVLGCVLVFAAAAVGSSPVGLPPDAASESRPALPWFLLGLAELSHHLGPLTAWVLLPLAAVSALVLAPVLDTSEPEIGGPFRGRRDEAPLFLWAWLGLGVSPLVVALFGPATRPSGDGAAPAVPALSEWFWLDLLTRHEPGSWLLRELPGVLLLLTIGLALPFALPRWSATRGVFGRHLRRLGRSRYVLLCALLAVFMLVPIGLAVRACGFGPWLRLGGGWWL